MIGFALGLVRDINGAVVSRLTITLLVVVPILPAVSVAVYVTIYVPAVFVFTALLSITTVSPPLDVAPSSV